MAGSTIAFLWDIVILGMSRPFPAPEMSSMEDGSGGLAEVLILTCPYDKERVKKSWETKIQVRITYGFSAKEKNGKRDKELNYVREMYK